MRVKTIISKAIALVIGIPIVIIGIILIPLPGPGILITFAGLFILSLEFEWAKKYVDSIRVKITKIYQDAVKRADTISKSDPKKPRDD